MRVSRAVVSGAKMKMERGGPGARESGTGGAAESEVEVYACRWQVELILKELKSNYRLDEFPTRKAAVVEALILASVLTLLVSRQLLDVQVGPEYALDAVRRRLRRQPHRVPEGRWASLFSAVAIMILDIFMLPARLARALARRLEPMLLHEARDPNVKRLLLLERVDQGVA